MIYLENRTDAFSPFSREITQKARKLICPHLHTTYPFKLKNRHFNVEFDSFGSRMFTSCCRFT